MRSKTGNFLLATLLLLILSGPGHTRVRDEMPPAPSAAESTLLPQKNIRVAQGRVSLDQAVAKVRRMYGGRVVKAETKNNVHRIRIMTDDGKVRTVRVDAKTGRIL